MSKKHFTSMKHFRSCLSLFLLLGIFGTVNISATTITNFPPSKFIVVDSTTPDHTIRYNPFCINQNGAIIGYKDTAVVDDYGKARYQYQLTDTIYVMKSSIWYQDKLDISQDFVLQIRLNFGSGNNRHAGTTLPFGHPERLIGDGICFVMHQKSNPAQIGVGDDQFGYGGIDSSFAIEFDTEVLPSPFSADIPGTGAHIAYMRNGSMTPLPGTYKQMQNNYAGVATDAWYCVTIVWRKISIPNPIFPTIPHWGNEMSTYMSEGPGGAQILRTKDTFNHSNSINNKSLMDGMSNMVTWGFTAHSCPAASRYRVEIVSLTTGNLGIPGTINLLGKSSVDTLYHNPLNLSDYLACGAPLIVTPLRDTITNERLICLIGGNILDFLDIDIRGAKFFVKNKNRI